MRVMPREQLAEFVRRMDAARARIAPKLPDVDPGDLLLILEGLLRPPGSRRLFLLRGLNRPR